MNYGERIRIYRKFKNLTQEELATKIGCTKRQIGYWETERSEPSIKNIFALAEAFGITTDQLLGYNQSKKDEIDIWCKLTGAKPEGIELMIQYFTKSLGWSKTKAMNHILQLFQEGIILQVMNLGGK